MGIKKDLVDKILRDEGMSYLQYYYNCKLNSADDTKKAEVRLEYSNAIRDLADVKECIIDTINFLPIYEAIDYVESFGFNVDDERKMINNMFNNMEKYRNLRKKCVWEE